MSTTDNERIVQSLYASFASGDLDTFMAPWDAEAVLHDPYGLPPHVGHEALRAFATAFFTHVQDRVFYAKHIVALEDRVAAHWVFEGTGPTKQRVTIDGLGIYYFNKAGKIVRVEEHWDAGLLKKLMG